MLGRAIATSAVERGHAVTCLARGSSPSPAGVVFISSDRDRSDGLKPVTSRSWDAVIELSRQPRQVRRAAAQLDTAHWVFISSGNVYADFSSIEQDESAALLPPLAADVMEDMSTYGEAKVTCEDAIRNSGASSTIIRSGLIAGPGDGSGRSGYWPWRFAHPTGDDVVVPDDPDFPCALIDVRDLASWIIDVTEQRLDGTFNATGPTIPLHQVLSTAQDLTNSDVTQLPVSVAVLAELGIGSWMGPSSLPLWIDDPAWRGFATMNTNRARAAGLSTRSLDETLRDALAYENQRTQPRQAGLTDDDERRVRAFVSGDISHP